MVDSAHCPLQEEDSVEDIKLIATQKLGYVHLGDAVLDSESEYYGHTHPPVGVHGGIVGLKELEALFDVLLQVGYLKKNPSFDERPNVSYEMAQYSGVSPETSAQFAFEMADTAFSNVFNK